MSLAHPKIDSKPSTHISNSENNGALNYTTNFKRFLDLAICISILPAVLPILGILWVVAKLDGGPGFFGHQRVGRNNKLFNCLKIRSMRQDSQTYLAKYLADNPNARAEWEENQKLKHDPRISKFGNFIRKTSLDELPQIFNVLAGDMSLVGPRPITEEELKRYGSNVSAYLAMKPGITGIWQTSGRSNVSYDERVEMDVTYSKTVSFWTDIKIMFLTAKTLVTKDAY